MSPFAKENETEEIKDTASAKSQQKLIQVKPI
jgi:hypothetical protein